MLGDQVADPGVQQRRGADAALNLVVLGPRGDRHRAERVPNDGRALTRRHRSLEHGLEVLAEAGERVVPADGRLAVAVAAEVEGYDAEAARGQLADHVDPVAEHLGPPVCEHERLAVRISEALGVELCPVAGADGDRFAAGRLGQHSLLRIGRDLPEVPPLGERPGADHERCAPKPDPDLPTTSQCHTRRECYKHVTIPEPRHA